MELFSSLPDFLSLLFLLCAILLLSFFPSNNNPSKKPSNAGYPFIGILPQFVRNRHRLLDWTTQILADSPTNTIFFSRPGYRAIMSANPVVIEHVLKTNFDNFPKGPQFNSLLEDFLGLGIFNSDGELWKVQRKTASFEFNTRSLRNFVVDNVRQEVVARLMPLLGRAARSGDVVDIQDVLERFAFDNVCKVAFNEDPACLAAEEEGDEVGEGGRLPPDFALAFKDAANLAAERFRYAVPNLWKLKRLLGVGSERRLRESAATVHDFAMKIIRSRKKEMENAASPIHDDLLSRFTVNADYSEKFLRDIVISFILAGRETTSSSLSWFFWLLSSRSDVELRILEEIKRVRSRNQTSYGEAFNFDELREMNYLHAAITETMRLYPPVSLNSVECLSDDVFPDGTHIRKGWQFSYNAYALGRMEAVWGKDCREYRPERWLDDGGCFRPESPFKFLAFHGGPRMCLGKEMAYIQMKSIAACILERFEVEVVGKERRPEMMLSLTLRMRSGLPVTIRERKNV